MASAALGLFDQLLKKKGSLPPERGAQIRLRRHAGSAHFHMQRVGIARGDFTCDKAGACLHMAENTVAQVSAVCAVAIRRKLSGMALCPLCADCHCGCHAR